jgi:hypothetical protein
LCKNEKCAKAAGKKAGGSKTALFRHNEGKVLCNWCYCMFMKTQHLAQLASALYPELA